MRLVLLVRDGRIPPAAVGMTSEWVDAATPTFAAQADAVTKLYGTDQLLPRRAARRALGYTDTQIRDMEAEDAEAYNRLSDQAAEFGPTPEPPPQQTTPELGQAPFTEPGIPGQRGPQSAVFREPVPAGR